ncbi:SOS response-associated peptidase [Frondihabitans sp. Leaf304]|uniref:SOS response-associated peptidase n=1 Tax=Frondihabitans sp. Leaf304 TaxID=1736329 RepID=UPI000A03717F|nr:SOS response-associated peptidase [Frondihabitans sp. Leaf304]
MCGRIVMARASSDLVALFDVDVTGDTLPEPSWNIAPTAQVSLLVDAAPRGDDAGGPPIRRLASAKWGLIPSWADDPSVGSRAFNARIETAAEKPTFRDAVVSRRAVIPASGYYEWVPQADGSKLPVYVSLPDDELMLFGALYEWWRNPGAAADDAGRWILSTTILTREAVGPLAEIHERMPVLVDAEIMEDWLDPHTEGDADLLEGISGEAEQHAYRVTVREVPGGQVGEALASAAGD